MEKISIIIITFNEEENIERCLKSVAWADEIVVIDSFSQDRTVEICRQFTDRVFTHEWLGFGKQKNLAAEKASHRWVMNLDADEVLSEECSAAIRKELIEGPGHVVYRFPRKNFIGGRWVRFGGWYPDWIYRFYDKTRVSFSESVVHEKLTPVSRAGSIHVPIEHYSYDDFEDYVIRQNKYSSLFARGKTGRGQVTRLRDIIFRPAFAFFRTYFLQQGFREGQLGLYLSVTAAFYTFLKYAKTRSF